MLNSRLVLLACLGLSCVLHAQNEEPNTDVAGNDQVAEIIKNYEGRGTLADDTPPTPAEEAVKQFVMRDGFEMELMASEPEVTQPLFMTWDSRGRAWVMQYRQYQFPAGLKILRYDQHLRAVFDKVPEPPPNGTPGADKITVFEDTDGDGLYDTHKDVITGLNIATSLQVGHGGIWVLNPPYLLFYPDADGDDVPDGDPEVHLSGFGLEDTHSVANSLLWGPDGWLYGANGSTTTCTINSAVTKNVEFQGQCIWRYHPDTKVFEVYAEGGGNTFSVEIDSKGRVFSGTNNGNTRGMFYPQGSYGKKNWGKHGPLTNPYSFGYFEHMAHEGDNRRFSQAFCIYEGGVYPEHYDGAIIGPNSLQNVVWVSERIRDTSTYRTVDEANMVETPDRWFRPVYSGVGPDGCVYLTDWYDTRLSHVRPVDDWHKTSGRVYRIKPDGTDPLYVEGDLSAKSSQELIQLFEHPNWWVRKRAVLELGWRKDDSVRDSLVRLVDTQQSLEALWALNLIGGLNAELSAKWLGSESDHIRRWIVRLTGDHGQTVEGLAELARTEPEVQVRSQIASTAKRVPPSDAMPVIAQLLRRSEDLDDLHMPLMIWWAVEAHAEDGRAQILSMLGNPEVWKLPMLRQHIASRLMQRYAMAGGDANLETAAELIALAPDDEVKDELMVGLNRAFQGMTVPALPDALAEALDAYQAARGESGLILSLRQGKPEAVDKAIAAVNSSSTDLVERIELVKVLGEIGEPKVVPHLLKRATDTSEPALQRVAMQALTRYDDPKIAETIANGWESRFPNEHEVRATAARTLASRPAWAAALLAKVDEWRIRTEEIPVDVVQQLRQYEDPKLQTLVEKHFGQSDAVSSPAKLEEIARLKQVLAGSQGNPDAGREHYTLRCAVCHKLFEEGGLIGPDLTGYERGNLDFWLPNIVDPSLETREGYQTYLAKMKDGRVLTGMIAAQNAQGVTLRDAANQTTLLRNEDIEELQAIPMSLMPEGLLQGLTDEQLVDLFAYLSLAAK